MCGRQGGKGVGAQPADPLQERLTDDPSLRIWQVFVKWRPKIREKEYFLARNRVGASYSSEKPPFLPKNHPEDRAIGEIRFAATKKRKK